MTDQTQNQPVQTTEKVETGTNQPQPQVTPTPNQAKADQLAKAREAKKEKNQVQAQARISHPNQAGSKGSKVEVQKAPEPPKVVTESSDPEQQGMTDEKLTIAQFRAIAATSPDVNALFQKLRPRLVAVKATALEMRRLGHMIEYDEK